MCNKQTIGSEVRRHLCGSVEGHAAEPASYFLIALVGRVVWQERSSGLSSPTRRDECRMTANFKKGLSYAMWEKTKP
jgi:hypothetical protein